MCGIKDHCNLVRFHLLILYEKIEEGFTSLFGADILRSA
jgi:hypothetical protein